MKNSNSSNSKGFGSDSSNYNTDTTDTTYVASDYLNDPRTPTQIVFDECKTCYEADPSLVFADLEDMLRFKKVKMSKAEKIKFIAAAVKNYKLSDTCKAAINVLCVAKFGGSI